MFKSLLLTICVALTQVIQCLPGGGGGGGGIDAGPTTDSGPPSLCPTTELAAGVTHPEGGANALFELEYGGRTRTFKVHVPVGYDASRPVPLVFVVHGLTQGAAQMLRGTDMVPVADEGGFIAVYPNGESSSWNAGSCCSGNQQDDVGFFRAMIDYVRDDLRLCVDRKRVYSTGFSNGAMMSYRLACEASDVFAAIASVAGSLSIAPDACAAAQRRHVPLLEIHGDGDPIVDYGEAIVGVDAYAALSGCGSSSHPATQPVTNLDTTCATRDGCPSDIEVTTCTIDDGGHCWYGNETCGTGVPGGQLFVGNNAEGIVAATAVWEFLERFDCPTCGL